MISDRSRAMLDAGHGCYMVAAATGDPYMELAEYVSRNHPDEGSPERQAFWDALRTSPYAWRPDNPVPLEAPWERIVR